MSFVNQLIINQNMKLLANTFKLCANYTHSPKLFIFEVIRKLTLSHTLLKESSDKWESVVGLEIHAQINAKSKLFSDSPAVFGSATNTEVSFFDAAFPGTLPVLNKYCVEAAIKTALSLNCTVHRTSTFDRKHYFYPDLPSGYQITQQFHPIASGGSITFPVYDKSRKDYPYQCTAKLKQIQIEQDSGRTFHIKGEKSLVDLNRAGIGLMELVFEPDLQNGLQAAALVKELINILKRIDTCTCEMEEGALRVDANISVNKQGQPLGVRTEVKNINSMRFISRAIDLEIDRQIKIIEGGGRVINETRAFDHESKRTVFMRDKEVLQDYRFMPEPNLPPLILWETAEDGKIKYNILNFDDFRTQMPILPAEERTHLMTQYGLSLEFSDKLIQYEGARDKFEATVEHCSDSVAVCDFLLNNLLAILNVRKMTFRTCPLSAIQLAELVELIKRKSITPNTANDILEILLNGDQRAAKEILKEYNWYLIADEKELENHCLRVIEQCPKVTKKYRSTKKQKYMSSLLHMLYDNTNNRAPYEESENMFKKLIFKSPQDKLTK